MEQNKRLSVALKGIIKNKPAQFAEDGECEEIINLRYEDNAWRGVGMKELLPHNLVTLNYYDKVVRPAMLPAAHYIAYSAEEHAVFLLVGSSTEDADEHTLIELPEAETFRSFAWMNNSLIVYTSGNLYAFQYMPDKENASDMFLQLADLRMPKLAIGEHEEQSLVYSNINFESTLALIPQEQFDILIADFVKKLADKRQDGLFFGNVSFYFAYKLFDGNYIKHSGAYVWNVAWNKGQQPGIYRTQWSAPMYYYRLQAYVNKPTVYLEYPASYADVLQDYKDAGLLQSLCIFMSADNSQYNVFESSIDEWRLITPLSSYPHLAYSPPTDSEVLNNVPDIANHFKVKEIPVDDLIASAGGLKRVTITLDRNQLASIETNENMPIDNFTAHKLIPGTHYLYNSRLHMGDIKTIMGDMPYPFIPHFYDAQTESRVTVAERDATLHDDYFDEAVIVEDNSAISGIELYILAEILHEGRKYISLREIESGEINLYSKDGDYFLPLRPLFSYPDLRAVRFSVLAKRPATDNYYRVIEMPEIAGTKATGTFTIGGYSDSDILAGDTITIGTTVLTAVESSPSDYEFIADLDRDTVRANILACIAAMPTVATVPWVATAAASPIQITIEARTAGTAGNTIITSVQTDGTSTFEADTLTGGTNTVEASDIFPLKKTSFHNIALYNSDLQKIDGEMYLPIFVSIPATEEQYLALPEYDIPETLPNNWHEPNRVQVSEVNNLFVYPAKQSYRIGNPDYTIRAMIVAQEPMTEMQFGQFPLYVFTAGGVFALEYAGGGEVLYSRITQFLTDIIAANVYPIALSGGAIVYQEENAVKVLIGRESKDISRQVLAESENPLYNQVHFITMVTDETVAKIREKIDDAVMGRNAVNFLVNSRIGYDSRTKEILFSTNYPEVFTGEKNYTLVYQLTSGAWYKRTEVYNDFIHSITGHLGLTRDRQGMLHVINLYYLDSEISLRAGDVSGMEYPWVFIQTRPMLLQSPFHKRIFDFVARFVAFNTGEAFNETVTRGLFGYLYDYFALLTINRDAIDYGYGALYNWYAATDERNITSAGDFVVPSIEDWTSLFDTIDTYDEANQNWPIAGGLLKSTESEFWESPNVGATNDFNFNIRGSGSRYHNDFDNPTASLFGELRQAAYFWTTDLPSGEFTIVADILFSEAYITISGSSFISEGRSIRLVRPASESELLLADGTACDNYVGNDGKIYRTVKIGTQVWLAANLAETLFRDLTPIPEVTDNAAWAALTTAGMCYYDNDESYGYTGGEVTSIVQKLAPAGFHILTLAEAQQIADIFDADALKEQGSAHWNNGNTGTNESLITLLGAGYRENDADFDGYREEAIIWLADEGDTGKAYAMRVTRESAEIVFEQLFKGYGLGVRMAMDEPELYTPGMTVQDRDGNIYDLVRVSREEVPFEVNYGLLYNQWAVIDSRKLTSSDDWIVPSNADYELFKTFIGNQAYKFMAVGAEYFPVTGNTGYNVPTNELGFNAKGAGARYETSFLNLSIKCLLRTSNNPGTVWSPVPFTTLYAFGSSTNATLYTSTERATLGGSVRLINKSTTKSHLETGTYIGNDGKIYPTITYDMGGGNKWEWLAEHLSETKFRNNDLILNETENTVWAAMHPNPDYTPALCAYNNDWNNAFTGSPAINIVLTKQNWASTKYADGTDIEYAQEEEEWTDEATDGKFCNYDDAYVIDIPPVISGELSSWFAHVLKMGIVADIDPKNLATTVQLQYGATTAYGTTVELDVIDAGVTEAVVRSYIMPRLTPGTYHWRIIATNSAGTTTGDDKVFTVYPGTNREQTEYPLDTFTGTTYYIDPDAATNGTGTEASPYNVWPATIGGNNIYLQKCGTTAAFSGVFSTINGACKISSYGTGTLPRITCTQYDSADNFRFMRSDYKVLIQNMKIDKADITGLGIYLVNAPGSTVVGCDISGFSVPLYTQGGGTGLNVQWSGVKVLYCNIYSCGTDGLYFRYTTDIEVAHCYIYDVNRKFLISGMEDEDDSPGDNIQVASAGTTSINVHHCTLDHSTTGNKFNFIIASDNSVVSLVNNHFIGTKAFQGHPVSGVYLTAPCSFARIYGNIFENHNLGIYNGGANTRAAYNIFRSSNKCIATTNNRVISAVNNIFIDYLYNGLERLSGATLTAKNNVFKSDTGIAINLSGTGTQTIDFNHFEGQGALQSGTNFTVGNTMFTSLVAGSENYYPLAGSPLINSGVNVDEDNDFDGQQVSTPPSKGIYE